MKPAFHADATVYGYEDDLIFAGSIQQVFDWNDRNGPARDLEYRVDVLENVSI